MPEPTPAELAAAVSSCPGYETSPNPCRCPCYGCKHHCSAHNPDDVDAPCKTCGQPWRKDHHCAAVPPPDGVRDQIAAAIRDAACDGDCGKTEDECARERIQPFAWHHGKLAIVEGSPEQFADAVLREPAIAEALGTVSRVRAECDRIEAAVRANPKHPDFDGAYLAAIGHIRRALNPLKETT